MHNISHWRRPLHFDTFRRENRTVPRYINRVPLTKECKTTIRDIFFEGKDSVKFSDWSRTFSEQWLKAEKMEKKPKYEPFINLLSNVVVRTFNRIDMNKNEVIDLIEFDEELSKIRGYFFMAGTKFGGRGLRVSVLLFEDGWTNEKINKNTFNCEFFQPLNGIFGVLLYPLTTPRMLEPTLGY